MDSDFSEAGRTQPPAAIPPPPSSPAHTHGLPGEGTLSLRDISLLDVAVAATRGPTEELRKGFVLALTNDVTPEKFRNILDQVARHTGRSADDYLPILGEILREVDGP
jgi:alkylhydroperoxidase/carboxymuconolactone decarboxylase family protein YurZ